MIPKFFDLVLNSRVDNVTYDNLKLTNAQGVVTVNDQTATLKSMKFNTLGASFGTTGSYSSKNLAHPKFNFGLNIKDLNFQKAFSAFNTIKTLVPLASQVEGVFGTTFNVSGEMGPDMLPNLATLSGKGLFDVVRAAIGQSDALNKIASLTTLPDLKNFVVINKKIQANLVNGNLVVQPFDLAIGDIKMTLGGQNSLTGALAYVTAINTPTGKLGNALNSQLTKLTGVQNIQGTDRVTLGLDIGGTVKAPIVKLTSGSMKAQGQTLVKAVAKQKALDLLGVKPRAVSKEDSVRRAGQTPEEAARQVELDKKQQRIDATNKATEQIAKGIGSLFGKPKPKSKPKPVDPEPVDTTKK